MDLRESMDHLWFPKYPECSSGLKEIRISSIFSIQLRMCVDEWLAYLLIVTCMTLFTTSPVIAHEFKYLPLIIQMKTTEEILTFTVNFLRHLRFVKSGKKPMFGLDSYSRQVFVYLDPILIYISLWIDCLFESRKIAVGFLWLSLPGDYRITDEALLAETT